MSNRKWKRLDIDKKKANNADSSLVIKVSHKSIVRHPMTELSVKVDCSTSDRVDQGRSLGVDYAGQS